MKNVFFVLSLINFCLSLAPIWKFDENTVPFFSSDSPNHREIETFKDDIYRLVNIYNKNGDGTISVQHKLYITKNGNTVTKDVQFGNMEVFYFIASYGQIICPVGKFYPLDSDGNQINIDISNPDLDWHLKCVGHGTGVFLSYYLNKDSHSLYGYRDVNGGIWDGGNEYQNQLYDLKIKNNELDNNNLYPIVFLALDGEYIKLIGAKQTLMKSENIHRTNVETKSLIQRKSHTIAFFSDSDDKFYLLTYDNNKYSIVYSLKSDIGNYAENNDIKNVGETIKTDLILPFSDKIEIQSMNFIKKTLYVYYTIKNLETGKINYGIMDLLSQQVLFNTDHEITNFEPLSNNEMLVFSPEGAFKICLFRNGDTCESSCPSGTSLVLDVNGNKCKNNPDDCSLKLVPDNICIDSCDTNIYIKNGNSCGLCEHFYNDRPYKFIKSDECLSSKPEGAQFYNENYKLLECSKGYQYNSENKNCFPHCYPSCEKCNDYSEDSTNHNCIICKEGYNLNGGNCEGIGVDTSATIINNPQTTFAKLSTAIISSSLETITSTTLKIPQNTNSPKEIILQDKCLSGSTLNDNCNNITNDKINAKLQEEILSNYAENVQMKIFKGKSYSAQVSNTSTEMNSFNPENEIPIIDLGYCETILKEANGIPLDQSLIIIKIGSTQEDENNNEKRKNLDVNVFNPNTFEKLNLSVCDNTTIDLYTPLVLPKKHEEIYKNLIGDLI